VVVSGTNDVPGRVAVTLSRDDFRDCDVRAEAQCRRGVSKCGGGGAYRTLRCGDEVWEQWSVVASVGVHDKVVSEWVVCVLRPSNELLECNGCDEGCCGGDGFDGWSDVVLEVLRQPRLADFSLSRLLAVQELSDFRGMVDLEPVFLVLRTDLVSTCSAASSLLGFVVSIVAMVGVTAESCGSTVTESRTRRLIGDDGGSCCCAHGPLVLPVLSINRAARADVHAMPVKKLLPPSAPCSIFLAMLLSKAARAEPILPFFMLYSQPK
jgi:hypothetical protein